MRDEDFALFIEEIGEATHRSPVPASALSAWKGKLPDQLLTYWKDEGWCGYANGRLWTVNPEDYEDLVDEWLEGSPLEQIDAFHVFARSAFGHLYLCGERTGHSATVCCTINAIMALPADLKPQSAADRDLSVRVFFSSSSLDDFDYKDESGLPLFERALALRGPLVPDEMYGFEPAIVAGGQWRLDQLRKVKLDQHLTLLRQLAAPSSPLTNIDIDKLLKS